MPVWGLGVCSVVSSTFCQYYALCVMGYALSSIAGFSMVAIVWVASRAFFIRERVQLDMRVGSVCIH